MPMPTARPTSMVCNHMSPTRMKYRGTAFLKYRGTAFPSRPTQVSRQSAHEGIWRRHCCRLHPSKSDAVSGLVLQS